MFEGRLGKPRESINSRVAPPFLSPSLASQHPLSYEIPGTWVEAWGRDIATQCWGVGMTALTAVRQEPAPHPAFSNSSWPVPTCLTHCCRKMSGAWSEEEAFQGPQAFTSFPSLPQMCLPLPRGPQDVPPC